MHGQQNVKINWYRHAGSMKYGITPVNHETRGGGDVW